MRIATLAVTTLAALLLAFAVACGGDDEGAGGAPSEGGGASFEGTSLTFAGFGGSIQDAEKEAWTDPFSEETGAEVLQDSVDYAKIKAQVESGNVSWDVAHVDTFFANANCGTLFEPITDAAVPLDAVQPDYVTNECGVPVFELSMLLMYDEEKFADDPPDSWADFFDTEKYPGKRGMWTFILSGALEAALLGDGVAPEDLYPIDYDRAFRSLDRIKDDILFAQSPGQVTEQLLAGSVSMALIFNARGFDAVEQGAKFAPVWKDNLRSWDNLVILKGSKNQEAARALLAYVADPEKQARLVEIIPYAPTTPDSEPNVSDLLASYLPEAHRSEGINLDQEWWAENFDEANRRWTDWQIG